MSFEKFADEMIDTNGIRLRVRHAGSGDAIVLLHGWCGSSHSWRRLAPLLAEKYHVIVPDMRGYGKSDKPASILDSSGNLLGGYDAVSEAHDIAGIIDSLSVYSAVICGHDMGAPVALAFSGVYGKRTKGVVYCDEPLLGFNLRPMTGFLPEYHGGFWQFGLNWCQGLPEILYAGHEEEFLRFIYSKMMRVTEAMTDEDVREHAHGMKQDGGIAGWVGWYRAVPQTEQQIQQLHQSQSFQSPLLGIGGEYGLVASGEQLKVISDVAESIVIPDCGHLLPEERPGEMFAALSPFLEKCFA